MESIEESAVETYCGLCQKILNPPFKISQIFVLEGSPNCALCSFCMSHVQRVVEIIQVHQLSWSENSPTGLKWMKASGAEEYMRNSEGSIGTYVNMEISEIDLEMINKDVNMGRTDPDIFEWEYHEIIKRIKKPSYREDICTVLRAYCAKNPNIGYCQGMSYICMWLLLFLDKNSAFYMFSFLMNRFCSLTSIATATTATHSTASTLSPRPSQGSLINVFLRSRKPACLLTNFLTFSPYSCLFNYSSMLWTLSRVFSFGTS